MSSRVVVLLVLCFAVFLAWTRWGVASSTSTMVDIDLVKRVKKQANPKGKARDNYMLFVNPASGAKEGQAHISYIVSMWANEGVKTDVRWVHGDTSIASIVASATLSNVDAVVAMGGDGTLSSVVSALLMRCEGQVVAGTDVAQLEHQEAACRAKLPPVGVIPTGTGNGMAFHLWGRSDPKDAAWRLIKGNTRPLDVLRATVAASPEPIFSVLSMNWGFVVDVVERAEGYRWLGASRYDAVSALQLLWPNQHSLSLRAQLVNDTLVDVNKGDLSFLTICNAPTWGSTMVPCPGASISDGAMRIVTIPGPLGWITGKRQVWNLLKQASTGEHVDLPYVQYHHAKRLWATLDANGRLAPDGESAEPIGTEWRVEVMPSVLRILH